MSELFKWTEVYVVPVSNHFRVQRAVLKVFRGSVLNDINASMLLGYGGDGRRHLSCRSTYFKAFVLKRNWPQHNKSLLNDGVDELSSFSSSLPKNLRGGSHRGPTQPSLYLLLRQCEVTVGVCRLSHSTTVV